MTTHEWRDRDDDNGLVVYRAKHHAGRWTFQSKPKKSDSWTYYDDEVPLEILESFHEILKNKIQRRRAPEKLLEEIEQLLDEARARLIDEAE